MIVFCGSTLISLGGIGMTTGTFGSSFGGTDDTGFESGAGTGSASSTALVMAAASAFPWASTSAAVVPSCFAGSSSLSGSSHILFSGMGRGSSAFAIFGKRTTGKAKRET